MSSETKPRGPVAAMYGSPGPVYKLPGLCGRRQHDPRSIHFCGPEWAFGIKSGKYRDDSSPGPKYVTGKNTRFGKDGTPQYSIYGRNRNLTMFSTPGPGTYSAENCTDRSMNRAPAYSFGTRHRERRTDDVPGPNRYSLPRVNVNKKSAPSPIVASRSKQGGFAEDLSRAPGPGAYKTTDPDKYLCALPKFTLTGRNEMPGDSTRKPGPGAYSPNYRCRCNASGPSFGIRHSQYTAPLIAEPIDD
ncbi:ciliary microtubule associated protein 1B-like [Tubulanus polymorphus]|uniref:ciliary microtubule associated protein 1B-like n=1 Tax=Tubulanus polymorphus TaxID=672921 RepID=UPI003DA5CED5